MPRPPFLLLVGVLLFPAFAHAEDESAGRLGHAVVPTFESVELNLDADRPAYTGHVRIELDVRESTDRFRLHSEGSTLGAITLTTKGRPIEVESSEVSRGLWELRAGAPLPRGRCELEIAFTNDFDTHGSGLYRLESGGDWYTFSQFEANDAREAFPCFDEPEFKIPWQVTLVLPKGHMGITNMPAVSEKAEGDAQHIVYKRTPPMPAYLLAVCTGPFETVAAPGSKVPIRIVTTRGQIGLAAAAGKVTPPLLAALERYFGRSYPYDKLDLIAVPEYWYGAMENPGAIVFVDNALLLPPEAGVNQQRRQVGIVAHELAHMWFGDLVTMKWWDDLWLNESFATWLGDRVCDEVYPELQVGLHGMDGIDRAKRADARAGTRTMRQPVAVADNLGQLADVLAYNKGHAVLLMFEQWLGPEVFRKGVRLYVRENAWKNAEAADLWDALSRASGRDVGAAMATFLEQPGVPLVTVEPGEGATVTLTQSRFTQAGVEEAPEQWQIPVRLRYSDGSDVRTTNVMLDAPGKTVILPGVTRLAWVCPDAGASGYYRWSLPATAMNALMTAAGTTLTVAERRGTESNLTALLEGGRVDGAAFFEDLQRFSADPDPMVIDGLLSALTLARRTFWTPALDASLAAYVRATLRGPVARFGLEPRPGDAADVEALRPELLQWMADGGHDVVALAQGEALTDAYFEDRDLVDPSMAATAMRVAAIRGDRARFDAFRERFESTRLPTERRALLDAFAWFGDDALAREALDYALSGPLRVQEIARLLETMSRIPWRDDMVFDWLREHYAAVAARIPDIQRARLASLMEGCSQERLDAIDAFYEVPGHRPIGIDAALKKVRAATSDCMTLRGRDGASVKAYLESHMAAR